MIWPSENPRAFKLITKHTLPVYCRSNKKSWMTQLFFLDALLNCSASTMEKYCLENNIPFKIVPVVDNASHILLLLVIFILISKCISASKYHLSDPTDGSRSYSSFSDLLPEKNIYPDYFCNWGRHWKDTDTILEGLCLWLHQESCLGWCHQCRYEWHLEEDTQEVHLWLQRICQGWRDCKNQHGCGWRWQTTLTMVWTRVTLMSS